MNRRCFVVCAVALFLAGCSLPSRSSDGSLQATTVAPSAAWNLHLIPVVEGLDRPVHVTHAGDGSGRLFVVEKAGRIRVVHDGALASEPFLDITDRVGAGGSEQGLLSVAFHPRYRENGLFFVNYTDQAGDTVVARFEAAAGAEQADPATARTLLAVEQPAANHNGGQIAFGPDGFLYIGMGDGGGAGDPRGSAQNPGVMLGKLLRIDVDSGDPYGIPGDNPFVATRETLPEIWAIGLRNPWRFTFDRQTGDLFIGDVGQNSREEINMQPAGEGGANYGWNVAEGSACFRPSSGCSREGFAEPIADYGRDDGCSVTGGARYRGRANPQFAGAYIFGDYCSGQIWKLDGDSSGWARTPLLDTDMSLSSFGEDEQGEIYALDMRGGVMVRLAAGSLPQDTTPGGKTVLTGRFGILTTITHLFQKGIQ